MNKKSNIKKKKIKKIERPFTALPCSGACKGLGAVVQLNGCPDAQVFARLAPYALFDRRLQPSVKELFAATVLYDAMLAGLMHCECITVSTFEYARVQAARLFLDPALAPYTSAGRLMFAHCDVDHFPLVEVKHILELCPQPVTTRIPRPYYIQHRAELSDKIPLKVYNANKRRVVESELNIASFFQGVQGYVDLVISEAQKTTRRAEALQQSASIKAAALEMKSLLSCKGYELVGDYPLNYTRSDDYSDLPQLGNRRKWVAPQAQASVHVYVKRAAPLPYAYACVPCASRVDRSYQRAFFDFNCPIPFNDKLCNDCSYCVTELIMWNMTTWPTRHDYLLLRNDPYLKQRYRFAAMVLESVIDRNERNCRAYRLGDPSLEHAVKNIYGCYHGIFDPEDFAVFRLVLHEKNVAILDSGQAASGMSLQRPVLYLQGHRITKIHDANVSYLIGADEDA